MNPTETPEIYMSKIMQNRKRIEQTIKKWEAEQQAKREGSPMPGQDTIDVAPTQQRAIDAAWLSSHNYFRISLKSFNI